MMLGGPPMETVGPPVIILDGPPMEDVDPPKEDDSEDWGKELMPNPVEL